MTIFPAKRKEFYASMAKLMLNPAISMADVVNDLASIQSDWLFKSVLCDVARSLGSGKTLPLSLQQHPLYFPATDIDHLKLALTAGKLQDALKVLSTGKESSLSKHLFSWTVVVGCILMILGLFALILVGIVPKFEQMFNAMLAGEPLPALTRLVLGASSVLINHYLALLFLVPIAFALYVGIKNITPRLFRDRAVNLIPSSRDHALEHDCLTFCQHMSIMLMCGTPVLDALASALPKVKTGALRFHLQNWMTEIENGEPMKLAVMKRVVKSGPLNLLQTALARPESFHTSEDFSDLAITYGERTYISAPTIHGEVFPILFVLTAIGLGTITMGIFAPLIKLIERLG